ncbi:Protein FAM70A, partial [Ophiophagus hannah]
METEVPWGGPSGDSKTGGRASVQEANEDLRPLYAGRCHYYAKSTTQPKEAGWLRTFASFAIENVCFFWCIRMEISGGYYEFIDVNSCQDIVHLYHLLWSATVLNILGLVLGIITAAILGGFKDMVTSYNTYHSTPHLPPYSAYDFQHSSLFATSSPSGLPEDPLSLPPSPSLVWSPTGAPPRYSPPYFPPSEKPPPYSP